MWRNTEMWEDVEDYLNGNCPNTEERKAEVEVNCVVKTGFVAGQRNLTNAIFSATYVSFKILCVQQIQYLASKKG